MKQISAYQDITKLSSTEKLNFLNKKNYLYSLNIFGAEKTLAGDIKKIINVSF